MLYTTKYNIINISKYSENNMPNFYKISFNFAIIN